MPQFHVSTIVSAVHVDELRRRGEPVVRMTIEDFGKRAMRQVRSDETYNTSNPKVKEYMRNWSGERIREINDTTRNRLRTVLDRDLEAGKQIEEIAQSVADVFKEAKGSRSVTIARNEVNRASNFASVDGYREAGIEQKEWEATLDDATREDHAELDGEVVDIDEPFTIGALEADYPGDFGDPAQDINCRCGVLPVVEGKHLLGSRAWLFKGLERARVPHKRSMRRAMIAAFEAQYQEVMQVLNRMEIAA